MIAARELARSNSRGQLRVRLPLVIAFAFVSAACTVSREYLVDPSDLAALAALPPSARAQALVGSLRVEDGKPVALRAPYLAVSLPLPASQPADSSVSPPPPQPSSRGQSSVSARPHDPVRVRITAPAPEVTAGAVLTIAGSILSVAGTLTYLLLRDGPHHDLALAGGIVELVSEPMMIVGTILWIHGLVRPPHEHHKRPSGAITLDAAGRLRF